MPDQTNQNEEVKPNVPSGSKIIGAGDLPVLPEYTKRETPQAEGDLESVALKIGWVGLGQCGGRLVDYMYELGYSRCVAINSTEQDLSSLKLKNKLCLGEGTGAGKDIQFADKIIKPHRELVFKLLEDTFKKDLDFILIALGAGGGTGSGFVQTLIEIGRDYFKSIGQAERANKSVGVMVSLPKESEGSKVQTNAYEIISSLVKEVKSNGLSPLIVIDNNKIPKLIERLPIRNYWQKVNEFICKGFHTINKLAQMDSEFSTFDKADLLTVMHSGIVTYGYSSIHDYTNANALTEAIQKQLSASLLADCQNLDKATHAALCIVAGSQVLDHMDMESVDQALCTMKRLMGVTDKAGSKSVLHTGIYEYSSGDLLNLFSIIGGVTEPTERINQLKGGG